MDKVKVVLVGVGGYGANYTAFFRERMEKGPADFSIEGIVDPFAEKSHDWAWISQMHYPVYASLDAFYRERSADLAMIATPIPLHKEQCICAMEHGSDVLVEKPLCPTVQDAEALAEAERRTGKHLAVGFQWSFSKTMLALKQDILDGRLGKPLYYRGFVSWQRFRGYYHNTWKGKYRDRDGRWILDCVITNATAHYLHNIFFVAGAAVPGGALNRAAMPETVEAETYHIKADMETPDLFALKGTLSGGVPFWFASSYSLKGDQATRFEYAFEKGVVRFNEGESDNVVRLTGRDGTEKVYGNPQSREEIFRKMEVMLRAVKTGDFSGLTCGVETIMPHLKVTDAMLESIEAKPVAERYLVEVKEHPEREDSDSGIFADTLRDDLLQCYAAMQLPSERGYRWAGKPTGFVPDEMQFFEGKNR